MPLSDLSTDRVPSLDGLRAWSIFIVLWGHAQSTRGYPFAFSPDTGLAVRVFFLISGFIITLLMIREEKRSGKVSLLQFYRRRMLRILPVFWSYLAAVWLLSACGILSLKFLADFLRPLTFTMAYPIWPTVGSWDVGHIWSLAIEEQFYLLWPLAFVLLVPRGRLALAVLVILFGPMSRCWIYYHPQRWMITWTILYHVDMLAWGCLLAILSEYHSSIVEKITAWRPAIGRIAAIAIIEFSPWYFHKAFIHWDAALSGSVFSMSAQAFAIAYLMASMTCIRSGLLYRLLNLRAVTMVGVMSYSLYIWQQLFLNGFMRNHLWATWPVNMVCVFLISTASYLLIERPMRSLQKRRRSSASVALAPT